MITKGKFVDVLVNSTNQYHIKYMENKENMFFDIRA